MFYIIQS